MTYNYYKAMDSLLKMFSRPKRTKKLWEQLCNTMIELEFKDTTEKLKENEKESLQEKGLLETLYNPFEGRSMQLL